MIRILVGSKELEFDPDIPLDVRTRIIERGTDAFRYHTASDAIRDATAWRIAEVEVFGVWECSCVAAVIIYGLDQGMRVRVPRGYTWNGQTDGKPLPSEYLQKKVQSFLKTRVDMRSESKYLHFSSAKAEELILRPDQ